MNDNLIDESEFTKPYNPWKRFGVFYLLAVIHLTGFYIVLTQYIYFLNLGDMIKGVVMIMFVLSPLALGLWMMTGDGRLVYLGIRTKISALTILEILYVVTGIFITIYDNKGSFSPDYLMREAQILGIYFSANFVLLLAIVLVLTYRHKKRSARYH